MQGSDEARLEALEARVAMLEGLLSAPPPEQGGRPSRCRRCRSPQPAVAESQPEPEPEREPFDLEELLGGRVLGWVGGIAVVLAAVFFLVMAVHNGWIGEPARVLLAFLGSTPCSRSGSGSTRARAGRRRRSPSSLRRSGALCDRRDRHRRLRVDLGSGGAVLAGLIGAAAAVIAVRWDSQVVADRPRRRAARADPRRRRHVERKPRVHDHRARRDGRGPDLAALGLAGVDRLRRHRAAGRGLDLGRAERAARTLARRRDRLLGALRRRSARVRAARAD